MTACKLRAKTVAIALYGMCICINFILGSILRPYPCFSFSSIFFQVEISLLFYLIMKLIHALSNNTQTVLKNRVEPELCQ